MRKINTNVGNWTLHGINVIPSDSIYIECKKAIENGTATQEYLQKVTGYNAPIIVDTDKKEINFQRF